MMGRRGWMAGLLVALAGCAGSGNPADGRLSVGEDAIVTSDSPLRTLAIEVGERRMPEDVEVGAHVRCEADAEPAVTDPKFPGRDYRLVRVLVLDGASKGKIGVIKRMYLRPVVK